MSFRLCPTLDRVHWENIFEDLEGQLAAQWEAERAVLDAESERLRIARLTLRARLQRLQRADRDVTLRLVDGTRRLARLRAVGADWIAAHVIETAATVIAPMAAVASFETDHGALLETLDDTPAAPDSLRERMTLGFMLRDFGRRRLPLRLALNDGETLHGTIDRAGADHLDLAVHEAGSARRAANVRAFRMLPLAALVWLQPDGAAL